VSPDPAQISGAQPIVQWSSKERINDIYRGLLSQFPEPIGFNHIGIWPLGPKPAAGALQRAAESGNSPPKTVFWHWAKRVFLRWQLNWSIRFFKKNQSNLLFVWNGIKGHRMLFTQAARALKIPVIYFEEAPLPNRITMDFAGVNYGCSLPRRIDFYAQWAQSTGADLNAWRDVQKDLVARSSIRSDVGQDNEVITDEKYIFCPLQVPGDSQITIYGDWISSVEQMIDELTLAAAALPDGWHMRIKEHPSARMAFGDKIKALENDKLRLDNQTDTFAQVAGSQAVLTVNSSVGLQAFFFDKPVLVLGKAFYAFGGVAIHVASRDALRDACRTPDDLGYDAQARDYLMTYLDQAYYPREDDLKSGVFAITDLIKRDQERDAILARL
jgi:capsular polysaccharide export protein